MLVETLESFPPGENPFLHDAIHMGQFAGGSIASHTTSDPCIMFAKHDHNEYVIVVDCATGQRIKVTFDRM